MKKYYPFMLFLLVALTNTFFSSAQYYLSQNRVWAMGFLSGVDFSGPEPVAVATSISASEGCAAVSKAEGGLLYYTNGTTIWNAAGNIMPNGADIFPGSSPFGETDTWSTTQAAVIVPAPTPNSGKYYVFSLGTQLFVNMVDMSLDNGMGDVVTSFPLRNVLLRDSLTEKMIAIPGCNNNVWLLVRSLAQPGFLAFEITNAGINTTPVVSFAGLLPSAAYFSGSMKVSASGNRIVATQGAGLECYDFDYTSGQIYNTRLIDTASGYGVALSPDGSKLYSSQQLGIYQYDLNVPVPLASKIRLGDAFPSDIKLAVNGKLYFNSIHYGTVNGTYSYLGCVEQPDMVGAACNFRDSVSTLTFLQESNASTGLGTGFPNEVSLAATRTVSPARVLLDTNLCIFPSAGLTLKAINGFSAYTWDNNTLSATRTVTQPGTYRVSFMTPCGQRTDTFKVQAGAPPVTLTFNSPVISTSGSYQAYRWYKDQNLVPGATGPTLTVTGNGWYSVVVTAAEGCTDSAFLQIGGTTIRLPGTNAAITVYPNPVQHTIQVNSPAALTLSLCDISGRVLYVQEKANMLDISAFDNGIYLLLISNENGDLLKTEKIVKQTE